MAPKRPSDRKSTTITFRLTKGERAALNKQKVAGESLTDVVRRLLFAPPSPTPPEKP
jgi:hypothetical protein